MKTEWIRKRVSAFHRDESGVTLVELLVVIAILAILAAVVVPNFTGLIGSGRAQAQLTEQRTVQTIVDAYMADKRLKELPAVFTITAGTMPTDLTSPIGFSAYFRQATICTYTTIPITGLVPLGTGVGCGP